MRHDVHWRRNGLRLHCAVALSSTQLTCTHTVPALAQVTTVRGKLRHGFDFDISISFDAVLLGPSGDEPRVAKGTVQVADASRTAAQARLSGFWLLRRSHCLLCARRH